MSDDRERNLSIRVMPGFFGMYRYSPLGYRSPEHCTSCGKNESELKESLLYYWADGSGMCQPCVSNFRKSKGKNNIKPK
jgi:hypothetical protein